MLVHLDQPFLPAPCMSCHGQSLTGWVNFARSFPVQVGQFYFIEIKIKCSFAGRAGSISVLEGGERAFLEGERRYRLRWGETLSQPTTDEGTLGAKA
jgi:hypothetical protein